ncbi:MAG: hypothetical protein WC285_04765 [Candidatus Gracilibacteria bacterium]
MANKAEAHKQEFTDRQLKAVDYTYVAANDNADLQKAVEIGLITDETRKRIEEVLGPDHANLLKAARDRIVTEQGANPDRAKAMRLAFDQVYGKFLLEEGYTEADPQHGLAHRFDEKLGHVLKQEIDPQHGLAQRSELMAARARLMRLAAPVAGVKSVAEDLIPQKEAELATVNATLANANEVAAAKSFSELMRLVGAFQGNDEATGEALNGYTPDPNLEILFPGITVLVADYKTVYVGFKRIFDGIETELGGDRAFLSRAQKVLKFERGKTFRKKVAGKKAIVLRRFYDDVSTQFTALITSTPDSTARLQTALDAENRKTALEQEIAGLRATGTIGATPRIDPNDVLEEAFTISLPLEQAEIDAKFAEARSKLDSITNIPTNIKADIAEIKGLVVSPIDKKKLEKAINLLRNTQGFFDGKPREEIGLIIDNLERITGIKPEVAIERATAKKKETEAKVKKAEGAREYFEKNRASEMEAAFNTLMKGVGAKDGEKLTDEKSKEIMNADYKPVRSYSQPIKETLVELNSIISTQGKLESIVDPNVPRTNPAGTVTENFAAQRNKAGKKKARAEKDKESISGIQSDAKAFHGLLLSFTEHATFLAKNGFLHKSYEATEIDEIYKQLRSMNPELAGVSVKDFDELYTKLEVKGWFKVFGFNLKDVFSEKTAEYNKDVRDADDNLKKKNDALKAVHDLSDTAAAKKIILAVVKRQHPELSLEEQDNLAKLILADDVAKIQTSKSYATLAKEGSENLEQLTETISAHDFRWKILRFRYKEGDKVFQPFKDLKPGDINVWGKIEKLFDTGRFDYKAGFFLLAAIVECFGEDKGTFTIVYRNLEKKLKAMMAEQIGVSKRMDEAYVRKVVDEAFEKQLKSSRMMVKAHYEHYSANKVDINKAKVKELNHRLTELQEQRRLGKVNQEVYMEKYAKILKEAQEYGVDSEMKLTQDATISGYMDSPEAQWLKDLGVDVGRFGKDKALAALKGTALTGVNAIGGAVKLGAGLTFQAALTPFRLARYPLFLIARPIAGFLNLFLANKLQVPGIIETARTDVGRVAGYFKKKGSETVAGAQEKTKKAYGEAWGHAKFERKKYAETSKVKLDEEAARIKELGEKADLKPLEVAQAPGIDFEALRKEIASADEKFGSGAKLADPKTPPVLSAEEKPKDASPAKKEAA